MDGNNNDYIIIILGELKSFVSLVWEPHYGWCCLCLYWHCPILPWIRYNHKRTLPLTPKPMCWQNRLPKMIRVARCRHDSYGFWRKAPPNHLSHCLQSGI